jgi:phosphohistidine phosphatase SixA
VHRGGLRCRGPVILISTLLATSGAVDAQMLSGDALVKALQGGGFVLVMRHASSPREAPDKQHANADNVNLERQLDESGRATAIAMGNALRTLKVPIGEVFTSPTYRALETVSLAQLPNPQALPVLGDGGHSMQGVSEAQAAWLKNKVSEFPHGTNTVIVTHQPNIARAFPQWASDLSDGETLVFGPDRNRNGGATLVARIKIEQWPKLSR